MAKQPAGQQVKTRLAPALSPEARVRLYEAMLTDRIDQIVSLRDAAAFVAITPPEAASELGARLPPRVGVVGQEGADLGERLAHVSATLLSRHDAVALVDSDTPIVPLDAIE